MMVFGKSLSVVVSVMLIAGCCRTFRSQRVVNDCEPFRGAPAMMYKPHRAIVSWSSGGAVTEHYCTLPVLYSVDINKAPVGTTKATIELAADGQLTKANAELDQKLPELIKAVGDAVDSVGAAQGRSSEVTFVPSIDPTDNPALKDLGYIVSIQYQEIH